jgi:hypothetical protein
MYKSWIMEQPTNNKHIMDRLVIFIHATKKESISADDLYIDCNFGMQKSGIKT